MEQDRFLAIANEYKDMIFRLALNRLGCASDADDMVQEVLLRLLRAEDSFDSPDHLRHWLIRVTLNCCKNVLRSPWRRRTVPLEEAAPLPAFDAPEDGELYLAVMALPEKYRTALYLFYYEELSVREMAGALSVSETTVTTRLSRARALLKKQLGEEWKHDQ